VEFEWWYLELYVSVLLFPLYFFYRRIDCDFPWAWMSDFDPYFSSLFELLNDSCILMLVIYPNATFSAFVISIGQMAYETELYNGSRVLCEKS
jgi:hypothetical protein